MVRTENSVYQNNNYVEKLLKLYSVAGGVECKFETFFGILVNLYYENHFVILWPHLTIIWTFCSN